MNRVLWVPICFAIVALAGCTEQGNSTPIGPLDPQTTDLGSKGAIQGLLVDDRFRPIQLVDDPRTEFQTSGFVLLQETGKQVQTTENGEFQFLDLEPGGYTIRVTAGGHEATPSRVTVAAGEFAEQTLVARRVASDSSFILTQEHSMFISCAVDAVYTGGNLLPCDGDLNNYLFGGGYSSAFSTDYSEVEGISYMVTEMLANKEARFEIQIRSFNDTKPDCTDGTAGARDRYAVALEEGEYVRIGMPLYGFSERFDNPGYCPQTPWWNDRGFDTILFIDHPYREELQAAGSPFCCGVGFTINVKAQFLQSVFLGELETNLDAYCVLC